MVLSTSAVAKDADKLPKQWDDDSKSVYELLVAQMQNAGADYAGSVDTLIRYAKTQKDQRLLANAYRTLLQIERYDEAVEMAKLWQKNSDRNLSQYLVLALMLNGDTDLAVSEMNKDLDGHKESVRQRAQVYVGMLLNTWYHPQSLTIGKALYERVSDDPVVTANYLKLLRWHGDIEAAVKVIDKPLFDNPRNLDWLQEKSNIYRYALQLDKAEKVWLDVLQDYPNEAVFRFAYAQFLYDRYDFSKALTTLEQVSPDKDLQLSVNLLKMMTHVQLQQYDEAEATFDYDSLSDREKNRAYFNTADMLLTKKQYAKAEKLLANIDESSSLSLPAAFKIGQCRYADSMSAGDSWFAEIKDKHHLDDTTVVQAKVRALQAIEKEKTAYQLLNDYIKSHPKDEEIRYTRAMVAAELQLDQQAVDDLKWLHAIAPANADVQNALGYTLLFLPGQLEESADLIKKSLFESPGSPAVVDSMGWLYHQKKQYEKAMPFFRYSYANYVDGEIIGHYIMNLLAAGKSQLAKQLYQLEIRYAPNQKKINYYVRDVIEQLTQK